MKNFNKNVLSALDSSNTNGSQIDFGQVVSASFHAYFGDTNAAGTFKLQASNDVCTTNNLPNFTVTNWVDIPTQTASVASGASALLTLANNAYKWVRAIYTTTAAGVQTIAVTADTAGSLSGKYFLISGGGTSGISYYVWLDNGSGVDPAVPGLTGIQVTYSNNDSAATIGAAIATALAAVHSSNDFTTSGTTTVTVTNKVAGPFVRASAGTSGFTVTTTAGGTSTINVNMNILSV
jgi:hypothetical protein